MKVERSVDISAPAETVFTWVSRSGGVTSRAEHVVEPMASGCRVRLKRRCEQPT